jgi:oligogalacturonide lyase
VARSEVFVSKGRIWPSESRTFRDDKTGVAIRQVTDHPSIHHQPFFFVPAYDDAMRWLFFISHRTGSPQILAERRATGALIQLTDRPDLNEWSLHPARNGGFALFTAGGRGWRLDMTTLREEELVTFAATAMKEKGMVGAAMGTTALSLDDRYWAVAYKVGGESELMVLDLHTGERGVILRSPSIGHMQFCPDDSNLLFYAGPLTDRVWLIHRDGSSNRRIYARDEVKNEWITHEVWIPGTRELAFVDWPHGVRAVNVDTLAERRVCSFNAWHACCDRTGTKMVADTNFPDIGLQLFDPQPSGGGSPRALCHPRASSVGAHWAGPFPYAKGPVEVYAPQHTHPHPSFSPDGQFVVYTSDASGQSQVFEATLP